MLNRHRPASADFMACRHGKGFAAAYNHMHKYTNKRYY